MPFVFNGASISSTKAWSTVMLKWVVWRCRTCWQAVLAVRVVLVVLVVL
jgi:hypothetical protein